MNMNKIKTSSSGRWNSSISFYEGLHDDEDSVDFWLIVNFLSHDLETKPEKSKRAKVCGGLLQDGRKRRPIRFLPSVPLSARRRRRRAKRLSCGATIISHYHLAATETERKSRGGLESRPKAARSRSQRDLGDAGTNIPDRSVFFSNFPLLAVDRLCFHCQHLEACSRRIRY